MNKNINMHSKAASPKKMINLMSNVRKYYINKIRVAKRQKT